MKSTKLILFAGVISSLLFISSKPELDGQEERVIALPGAQTIIDATRFDSLQAAIDALPATGGRVQMPPGEFTITEPLRLPVGEVTIAGSGPATHIRNANTAGRPAILVAHPEATIVGNDREHELWRIELTGFRLTGNPQSGHGIAAHNINELLIDSVTVSHHGGDGIFLDYCYEDPRICDSIVTYNKGTGLNLQGCHDIVVSSNQFEENGDGLHCFDVFNLCMTGNCLDDHLGHGVVIEKTYGSVVAGNMIEECAGTAILLDRDCYGITLSANVIAHNDGGIDLRDAHGCSVSANTFTIMKQFALTIGPSSGRVAVAGNSFCNSDIGNGALARGTDDMLAAGVVLDGASEVGLNGNVFSGLRPKGVEVSKRGAAGVLFSNNILSDAPTNLEDLEKRTNNLVR